MARSDDQAGRPDPTHPTPLYDPGLRRGVVTVTQHALLQQVQYLTDRVHIGDTLIAFARAIDTRDWDGYANLFTEDGVLELPFHEPDGIPSGHHGRDGMAGYVSQGLGRFRATHHLSANHQIAIDGDIATTVSYCQCIHRFDEDPSNVWELGGWYRCALARDGDGWLFTRVSLESVWEHNSPFGSDQD
jgi:ketosteroid isomerase-like protein